MHRAFGIDVLACAHCGGRLRLIATLHDPAVIRTILAHLRPRPLRRPAPARPDRRLEDATGTVEPAWRGVMCADSAGPLAD
jgi:hypothetical protein